MGVASATAIGTYDSCCVSDRITYDDRLNISLTSTQPCGVYKSSTSFSWGKGRNVTSAGWQVTLSDPIWHVSFSSEVANCYIRDSISDSTRARTSCYSSGSIRPHHSRHKNFAWFERDLNPQRIDCNSDASPNQLCRETSNDSFSMNFTY